MRPPHLLPLLKSLLQHLRDPRIQVWLMVGSALLLLGIGHVRAWSGASEGKNQAHRPASRLLVAGARLDWTESFGPAQEETRRPTLALHAPAPPAAMAKTSPAPAQAPMLEIRSAMQEAAAKPWNFLGRPLRQQLAVAARTPQPLHVRLVWSGDPRGNAALVAGPWNSTSRSGQSAHFVIGNGSRSGDGEITALSAKFPPSGDVIEITLIGKDGHHPTDAQKAALGELLHHVEALTGHLLLPGGSDGPSELSL